MSDVFGLQFIESVEYGLNEVLQVFNRESFVRLSVLGNQVLQVHLCALHDDEGVLLLEVLVDLHLCDEVAVILYHVLTVLR